MATFLCGSGSILPDLFSTCSPSPNRLLRPTQLLQIINPYSPRAIGLDISHPYALAPVLEAVLKRTENFISACQSASSEALSEDTNPSPSLPIKSLGFSDFPVDPDGFVRRQLVWMTSGPPCDASESFSLRLAQAYLKPEGISPFEELSNGERKLGQSILIRLSYNSGGFNLSPTEAAGYQILFNQRYVDPQTLSLRELLNGDIAPDVLKHLIQDRIILIGVNQNDQDRHLTSNSVGLSIRDAPGVMIHGHMVSQLLDAALVKGTLLWWWPQWGEALWIMGWSLIGASLAWRFKSLLHLFLSVCISALALYGLCLLALLGQGWIPLGPSVLAIVFAPASVTGLKALSEKSSA